MEFPLEAVFEPVTISRQPRKWAGAEGNQLLLPNDSPQPRRAVRGVGGNRLVGCLANWGSRLFRFRLFVLSARVDAAADFGVGIRAVAIPSPPLGIR